MARFGQYRGNSLPVAPAPGDILEGSGEFAMLDAANVERRSIGVYELKGDLVNGQLAFPLQPVFQPRVISIETTAINGGTQATYYSVTWAGNNLTVFARDAANNLLATCQAGIQVLFAT